MTRPVPSVLHVNDCASTAAHLIAQAAREGYQWDLLPVASGPAQDAGPAGLIRRGMAGAAWLSRLAAGGRSHDIVHIHSAGILRHARFGVRRYVLHCHGTDVRTQQYLPAWAGAVRAGLHRAEAVFYSTPDLAEHVLPHRSDAAYLPVPIDMTSLPRWSLHPIPRVVFASRWGTDKGGRQQLDVAARIVSAVGDRAEVVGLDWGPLAKDARAAGVRLVGPLPRPVYLGLLASAHAVVGQSAGILAASELEALGTGAPLVMPIPLPLYSLARPPVVADSVSSAVEAVAGLVSDVSAHDPEPGRAYVAEVHGVDRALPQVLQTYQKVLSRRAG